MTSISPETAFETVTVDAGEMMDKINLLAEIIKE